MEAPEKLYIWFNHPHAVDYTKLNKRRFDEEVEYTRTDAFIEKAEKYLTEKFIKDVSVLTGGVISINFNVAISNFVKYMKGE